MKMAKTYAELQEQIEKLQEQAEKARLAELDFVIQEIKSKIKEFNLTAKDLGLATRKTKKQKVTDGEKPKSEIPAKYRNPKNKEQTWTGRGRKPLWVQELLDSGKSLESILIK